MGPYQRILFLVLKLAPSKDSWYEYKSIVSKYRLFICHLDGDDENTILRIEDFSQ